MSLVAILAKVGSLGVKANGFAKSLHPFVGQKSSQQEAETQEKIKKLQDDLKKSEEILAELSEVVETLAKELQAQVEIVRRQEKSMYVLRWISFVAFALGVGACLFAFFK